MSLPAFPENPAAYPIEDSISRILTSIAMEEIGLSHILNAEGEKLQFVLGTHSDATGPCPTIPELLAVNESIQDMLRTVTTSQMFLFAKMSAVLGAYMKKPETPDTSGTGTECPACPDGPTDIVITASKGGIYEKALYLPQGSAAELEAVVLTCGDNRASWSSNSRPGFTFTAQGNVASVRVAGDAPVASALSVRATANANGLISDTRTIIAVDAAIRDIVAATDGALYADYGDNTFRTMNPDGIVTGALLCGGLDRVPGTADDRPDVTVSDSGVKYLGPNADSSWQKAGPDGLLGTGDDIYVWPTDSGGPIAPCNETTTPITVEVRNILVSPSPAEVLRGGSQLFTATVYNSNNSVDKGGVTWEVRGIGSSPSVPRASIDENGMLKVDLDASDFTVVAISKTNPAVEQPVSVTVKSAIKETPDAVMSKLLTTEKTGDVAEWAEIAQNGPYSLIVRTAYLNNYTGQYGDPQYQATIFGPDNGYGTSHVRRKINLWFAGAAPAQADNLAADARLRNFTVKNNAPGKLGIGTGGPAGTTDSFSSPVETFDRDGTDIAFALSYSEAAAFLSTHYKWGSGNSAQSVTPAPENFARLQIPGGGSAYSQLWLRSPGNTLDTVSSLGASGSVFQAFIGDSQGDYGLIYPALWVDSAIFN